MAIPVELNEAAANRRRVYFQCFNAVDGITPEVAEAGSPQLSLNGAAWTSTGISALTAIGNGRYYADVDQSVVNGAVGDRIETRYASVTAAETVGDTLLVVAATGGAGTVNVWESEPT